MTANLTAVVLGGTGGVGKGIVKALAKAPEYTKVVLIARKAFDLPASEGISNYEKFEQKTMDFDKVPEYGDLFKGHDVGFYAIGVSQTAVSEEVYRKIELDNALALAKLMKDGGIKDVHFVTGRGTKKDSKYLFGRVKAEVEETIGGMGFRRVAFYRPGGVIHPDRKGMLERAAIGVMGALDFKRCITVDSEVLGWAIVANSLKEMDQPVEILENNDINKIGKSLPK